MSLLFIYWRFMGILGGDVTMLCKFFFIL